METLLIILGIFVLVFVAVRVSLHNYFKKLIKKQLFYQEYFRILHSNEYKVKGKYGQ